MLMTLNEAAEKIREGALLHIAGTEALLKALPKGNWIGGSTEYFMAKSGGKVSDDLLFVTLFPYKNFKIQTYGLDNIANVAADGYDNGFSLVILPFDSGIHREYAENAAGYEDMFIKNVAGWVSGVNLNATGQTAVAVNGLEAAAYPDKAAALHLQVPDEKTVAINILNIFEQDENAPVMEFAEEGFSIKNCVINGKEVNLADYIAEKGINTKLPLVGDYSGNGVNIAVKTIEKGTVSFYAPVFSGIKYRMAKNITDYEKEFNNQLANSIKADEQVVFSCNCILNFLYGELEGKHTDVFNGPITFGEIAYQLVNQTLVYISVYDK